MPDTPQDDQQQGSSDQAKPDTALPEKEGNATAEPSQHPAPREPGTRQSANGQRGYHRRRYRGKHSRSHPRHPAEPAVAVDETPVAQQTPPQEQGQRTAEPSERARESKPPFQPQQPRPLDISVIVPLMDEEESLRELHQQLRSTLNRMNVRYEVLFVDDGSTDNSFRILRDLKRLDHRIKVIRFRRNYGKSAALAVGFEHAQGNIVITIDADLQDDPAEIPGLVKKVREGLDLVSGWKKVRRDPLTKTIPSRFFNFVTSVLTGIHIHDFNCGLKAYRREVAKSVKVYGELHRYIPVLAHWEGFSVGEIPVQHRPRKYGRTKFGVGRFWKGFLDLMTALFTTRYFRRPLHLFGLWGMLCVLAGLVIDGWLVVEWFLGTTALSNRPLFLVGVMLVIVGIQFVSIGLLGELISKTRQTEDHYAIRDIIK